MEKRDSAGICGSSVGGFRVSNKAEAGWIRTGEFECFPQDRGIWFACADIGRGEDVIEKAADAEITEDTTEAGIEVRNNGHFHAFIPEAFQDAFCFRKKFPSIAGGVVMEEFFEDPVEMAAVRIETGGLGRICHHGSPPFPFHGFPGTRSRIYGIGGFGKGRSESMVPPALFNVMPAG